MWNIWDIEGFVKEYKVGEDGRYWIRSRGEQVLVFEVGERDEL